MQVASKHPQKKQQHLNLSLLLRPQHLKPKLSPLHLRPQHLKPKLSPLHLRPQHLKPKLSPLHLNQVLLQEMRNQRLPRPSNLTSLKNLLH
uniref:Uncharacterized protein n=1 Tax=Arcella intermedia TaxID=1963864 RepID=A0A6B2LKM9_9EUKA